MSGRIRTVKPELLEDAVTAGLSDMAFRLFVSMILLSDDHGRLRAEPGWLMGQIYWARSVQGETFLSAMEELKSLVVFYEWTGQRYAWIRNWAKHQKVSHPAKPRLPAPPEVLPKPSGDPPEDLRPDLRPRPVPPTPTTDPRPEADPGGGSAPEVRTFAAGTAHAVEAMDRFVAAVATSTGKNFALTRAPYHPRDLCDVMNGHRPPDQEPFDWLSATVAAWVTVTDPKYAGGWTPAKLLDWLNAGRPDRAAPRSGRQPHDATWLQNRAAGMDGDL